MAKTFHCMKLVESKMVKIPVLTNNLCYPRIRKKLMFCETYEQYLVANVITCLRVRAFFHKTVWVCHVYCTLKLVSRVGLL